jgi:hypothetical protein
MDSATLTTIEDHDVRLRRGFCSAVLESPLKRARTMVLATPDVGTSFSGDASAAPFAGRR